MEVMGRLCLFIISGCCLMGMDIRRWFSDGGWGVLRGEMLEL